MHMVSTYLILRKENLITEADERSQAPDSGTMLVAKLGYVKALNLSHGPPRSGTHRFITTYTM
jgi:hypothetical protein